MKIDNSHLIRQLLNFEDDYDVYHLQILKRRKENPEVKKNAITISVKYIKSLEDFDKQLPFIKRMCEYENARAYINLNPRNLKKIVPGLIKQIGEYMENDNYHSIDRIFETVAGSYKAKKSKRKWIVDIDSKDEKLISEVSDFIYQLYSEVKGGGEIFTQIPTLNGVHLICTAFNNQKFSNKFEGIDIQKNNPTLLYFNDMNDSARVVE